MYHYPGPSSFPKGEVQSTHTRTAYHPNHRSPEDNFERGLRLRHRDFRINRIPEDGDETCGRDDD